MIRNWILFGISLLIYGSYGLAGLLYLAGAILLSYGAGRLTHRWRFAPWIAILAVAGGLLLIKLEPLTGMGVLAPLGVSYFSLQLIGYNVDVVRGKYPAETNLFRFALFASYIPHLFLGPIERYDAMGETLFGKSVWCLEVLLTGGTRAMWGLYKKYVVAAHAGTVIAAISADTECYRGSFALVAMLLYSVELYADFSGGIDLVLGLSHMVGIRLSENFNTPFFSQSVQEFWRRWHVTLGAFLRDYVYIPLGGNRKGRVRKVINLIVTFLVSGLWHGVEYLGWGLLHGVFVAFGTKLETRWKSINRIGTFLAVSLLWCFFVWPDMGTALSMLGSVFTTWNYGNLLQEIPNLGLGGIEWAVFALGTLSVWFCDWKGEGMKKRAIEFSPAAKTAILCALGLVVLLFGRYGIGFDADAFIYSRF